VFFLCLLENRALHNQKKNSVWDWVLQANKLVTQAEEYAALGRYTEAVEAQFSAAGSTPFILLLFFYFIFNFFNIHSSFHSILQKSTSKPFLIILTLGFALLFSFCFFFCFVIFLLHVMNDFFFFLGRLRRPSRSSLSAARPKLKIFREELIS